MFKADLHCHSTSSDGSLTPVELVLLAKSMGLQGLSITDHDTFDAYKTALPEAARLGIILETGVEFSCNFQQTSIHVLGYGCALTKEIELVCCRQRERRVARNRLILGNLQRRGISIFEEELGDGVVGRLHMAHALVKRGAVADVREAFTRYLGDGQCCYERGDLLSVEEAIAAIQAAQGKAFLAHPHLLKRARLIKALLELPFDGVECYYGRCTPAQEAKWLKVAKSKGWLVSGGSDFHGTLKPYIALGCSWVNEELFSKIFIHHVLLQESATAAV